MSIEAELHSSFMHSSNVTIFLPAPLAHFIQPLFCHFSTSSSASLTFLIFLSLINRPATFPDSGSSESFKFERLPKPYSLSMQSPKEDHPVGHPFSTYSFIRVIASMMFLPENGVATESDGEVFERLDCESCWRLDVRLGNLHSSSMQSSKLIAAFHPVRNHSPAFSIASFTIVHPAF